MVVATHGGLQGIEVIDVDLGSAVPTVRNLRALPTPTAAIWPQVLFDLDYEGGITIVLEVKVDLRDGAAWGTLDRVITRFEGAATAAAAADPSANPALASAFSPGDSDADSEVDSAGAPSAEGLGIRDVARDGPQPRGRVVLGSLRKRFAHGIRQLAEVAAERISAMQLRLHLHIKSLRGEVYAWVPPPPGDRLWFSFLEPPELVATATPMVGGRLLKYSAQAARVSGWVAGKLQGAITKNLTFPSCADIPLPLLLAADAPAAGAALPAFLAALQDEAMEAAAAPVLAADAAAAAAKGLGEALAIPSDKAGSDVGSGMEQPCGTPSVFQAGVLAGSDAGPTKTVRALPEAASGAGDGLGSDLGSGASQRVGHKRAASGGSMVTRPASGALERAPDAALVARSDADAQLPRCTRTTNESEGASTAGGAGPGTLHAPNRRRSTGVGLGKAAAPERCVRGSTAYAPTTAARSGEDELDNGAGVSDMGAEPGIAGAGPGAAGEAPGGGEAAGRSGRTAWLQQHRELASSAVVNNWEAFKSRNPQTVLQGRKLASSLVATSDRLRGKAEEQVRKVLSPSSKAGAEGKAAGATHKQA
ncbi:hypothetical protein WJX81_005057 [Elliptochloris bilobata]|uniref:SMP-LTD domain-containing protein n=1 Tax=Elliptochloris bilobata TaxID=381761 RepID=A0AAW1SAS0_9CHLO